MVPTILLSGATGFIGAELSRFLTASGHRVVPLVRGNIPAASASPSVAWNPSAGTVDRIALAEVRPDAVINLAGEPIARRWTAERRRNIRESRVRGTRAIAEALAETAIKPAVFISGSAIGYYGADRGDELLTESSSVGSDFLSEVSRDWEQATAPAATSGIRTVLARTGIVLGRDGGALQKMLPPFQVGVGGPLGSGRQWMSWIALQDVVRAFAFFIESPAVSGPVNLVAPLPERNSAFAAALGHVLGRPAIIPTPAFALELMFGEAMARGTILASQRVVPERLAGAGFEFRHPRLESALADALRR